MGFQQRERDRCYPVSVSLTVSSAADTRAVHDTMVLHVKLIQWFTAVTVSGWIKWFTPAAHKGVVPSAIVSIASPSKFGSGSMALLVMADGEGIGIGMFNDML